MCFDGEQLEIDFAPVLHIENVSMVDVKNGNHFDCGENSMLIQIVDPAMFFPTPKHKFKEVHQFEFMDVETENDSAFGEFAITDQQAETIAGLLKHAFDSRMHVVVHCVAGVCRSGAVVEVATMLGYTDPKKMRIPNTLVKKKLMKAFGWTYDSSVEPVYRVTDAGILVAIDKDYGG